MTLVNYGLLVLVLSVLVSFTLKAFVPNVPVSGDIEVLSVSSPRVLKVGERYSVHGGLILPQGQFEKRFRICQTFCRSSGWGIVEGPGEWWGYFGALKFDESGIYDVSLVLYAPRGSEGARAVGEVSWQVVVE